MDNQSGNFSVQEIMRLARTPAGQKLIAILQQADPSALQNAARQASGGNMQQAKSTLEPLLRSSEVQDLITQLGGELHGKL